jgi:hypothetical protein
VQAVLTRTDGNEVMFWGRDAHRDPRP